MRTKYRLKVAAFVVAWCCMCGVANNAQAQFTFGGITWITLDPFPWVPFVLPPLIIPCW